MLFFSFVLSNSPLFFFFSAPTLSRNIAVPNQWHCVLIRFSTFFYVLSTFFYVFPRFSTFFCVFLRFSSLFFVILRFFYVFSTFFSTFFLRVCRILEKISDPALRFSQFFLRFFRILEKISDPVCFPAARFRKRLQNPRKDKRSGLIFFSVFSESSK